MKRNIFALVSILIYFCGCVSEVKGSSTNRENLLSDPEEYRKEMRNFVKGISSYARTQDKNKKTDFIVIPQNGQPVAWNRSDDENDEKNVDLEYMAAIDGTGREDTFYGYYEDERNDEGVDFKTTTEVSEYFIDICSPYKQNGKSVISIDYCKNFAQDSYVKNDANGFIGYASPSRSLEIIPSEEPHNVNNFDCTKLSDCKNCIFFLNYENFSSRNQLIESLCKANYDLLIIDCCFNDGTFFTAEEIAALKVKANGGKRIVVAYMSIGEAEDYRWYWKKINGKQIIEKENPDWEGNYKVYYWKKEWQDIIYGNDNSYTAKILEQGFDGTYLDIIDAYEYFENK